MSNAVGLDRVSKIVGYQLTGGNFSESTPNLPQRVAVLAEANTANQVGLDTTPIQITSANQAGQLFGWGSPIHIIMRILFPFSGDGIGGIPVIVYPQAQAPGATAKVIELTPSGVATKNGTHTLVIAGREGLDAQFYNININQGDAAADITLKIQNAISAVLGCPMSVVDDVYASVFTSKWKGQTAQELNIAIDDNGDSLGISYLINTLSNASGTPDISAALAAFGNEWNTLVVNSYGAVSNIMTALEQFNGTPDAQNPTGRFAGIVMKPFTALTGSTLEDPSSLTDPRANDVTIAICPAPLSLGLSMEAAANCALLLARQAQDSPHLDMSGKYYPDMPTPTYIGAMSDYNNRDTIVKKGCSTVDLRAGQYQIQDFVTTYHPQGESVPNFRYVRSLVIDFNVRFGYYNLEQINVVDHVIAADGDIVTADNVIKPKQWTQILGGYADDLAKRALITVPQFMKDNLSVALSTSNPDRLQTSFKYKRSGFARISDTVAIAGFNFGSN